MLQQSLSPTSRRKLLVLDCNGLLFWRVRKQAPRGSSDDLSKLPPPNATSGQFAIFARPHLRDFLQWCTEHFVVVVWSTAQRKNLEPMVKLAFEGLPPPALVLDQTDCTATGQSDGDRPLMLKELSRLWAHPQLLAVAGSYGAADTILVDDSPYKTANNPGHTAIHPHEWLGPNDPNPDAANALRAAGALRGVLDAIAAADDVRTVVSTLFADSARERSWSNPAKCALLRRLQAMQPATQPPPTDGAAGAATPSTRSNEAGASILGMLGVVPPSPPREPRAAAI